MTWNTLGYDNRDGDFAVPCFKRVGTTTLSWTHDTFGRYTLHAHQGPGSVQHLIPGTYSHWGECPPENIVRKMEARLLAAIHALSQ